MKISNSQKLKEIQIKPNKSTTSSEYTNLIKLSQSILTEINFIRTNPSKYLQKLKSWQNHVCVDKIEIPKKIVLKQKNIEESFNDLIEFFKQIKPLNELSYLAPLANSAQDLIYKMQLRDNYLNDLNDNENENRIKKYGKICGSSNELVYYGSSDSELIVLNMLLNKKNGIYYFRESLMSPLFRFIGIGCGALPNNSNEFITVIDLCEEFYYFNEYLPSDYLTSNQRKSVMNSSKLNTSVTNDERLVTSASYLATEYASSEKEKIANSFISFKDPIGMKNISYLANQINSNSNFENKTLLKRAQKNIENVRRTTVNNPNVNTSPISNGKTKNIYHQYMTEVKFPKKYSIDSAEKKAKTEENYKNKDKDKDKDKDYNNSIHFNEYTGNLSHISPSPYNNNTFKTTKLTSNYTTFLKPNSDFELNDKIDCININKKVIYDGDRSFFLVKKTIFYIDGTLNEMYYREEKN